MIQTPTLKIVSWQVYAILAAGILAVSLSAVFIRLAQAEGIPSLLIAAFRLTLAAALLTPITLRRHQAALRGLSRSDFLLIFLSGLFLALHFILWTSSLEYTSVLISVVLVTTTPLWSALLELIFLRARISRLTLIGLLIAIAGGIIISLPAADETLRLGNNPLFGGLLAVTGAIAMAVYLVIGRKVRENLPLLPYIWLVYSSAAVFALFAVLLTSTPITGYSNQGYLWMILVSLFPQLIGHTSFNYALEYLSATFIGIVTQSEPVGSAIFAFFIFQEIPRPSQIFGSLIILGGVILASLGQGKQSDEPSSS